MKSYWLVGLATLLGTGVLASHYFKAPRSTMDLVHDFPFCTRGPILAPSLPLGSCESAPFLGQGWREPTANPYRETRNVSGGSRLRLYLAQPISVELTLEGRLAPSSTVDECEVEAQLRQSARHRMRVELRLTKDWQRIHLTVPDRYLSQGYNTLRLVSKKPTQWRVFQASVTNAGRGTSQQPPQSEVIGTQLNLPFGQSVAYPVRVTPNTWLTVDGIEPWLLPGGPALTQGRSTLQVRIRSGSASPPADTSWYLAGEGRQRVHLQTHAQGQVELSLMAIAPARPLPGQAGLRLGQARVESWDAPPPPPPGDPPLPPATENRPNVVLYLIDTLRADHLGCYGYAQPTSPRIDEFAKDGVLFADCTAQSGWTKPATTSILTSMLPRQHGAMGYGDRLPRSSRLISQVLSEDGYETRAMITNPFVSRPFGFDRGYDDYTFLERVTSEVANREVLPWLKSRQKDVPFFLYMHTMDPHLPYGDFSKKQCWSLQSASIRKENKEGEDDDIKATLKEAVKAYDGEIMANDASFGALLDTLKETGQYDNTIIVLVSDHGEELLDHGRMGHNNSLYQELLHVPLIIKFPASRDAGTRIEPCWQQIDIAPTILACAGVAAPETMVGKAYIPGGPAGDPQRPALISLKTSQSEWQGKGQKIPRMLHMDAVRRGHWLFSRTWVNLEGRLEPQELYDLADDPAQKDNLAPSYPEVTVGLHDLMLRAMGEETATDQLGKDDVGKALRSLHYLR